MSHSDLVPSPIEQRVRRTLAARADDMAPGDGADDQGIQLVLAQSAGTTYEQHRDRGPRRFRLVAAVVVIVGLGLAAFGAVVANDDGSGDGDGDVADDGNEESVAADVALVTAPRDLVTALEDERDLATNDLIGTAEAVALPVDDTGEARSHTDAATAAFDAAVTADPDGSVYQGARDGLDGLAALRGDIDAYAGPRDVSNLDLATEVFNRYGDMIGGLLDAQGEAARSIDDPDVQVGAQLHVLGLRLEELTGQLGRAALLNALTPGGSAALTELSILHAQVSQGQDEVLARATGTPYEAAATTVIEEIEASGLLDAVATGMQGTSNVAELLAAMDLSEGQGWPAFLDRVEELLATAQP